MNQDKAHGMYFRTDDYAMFKKLLGNREVTQERIEKIIQSIKTRGYITNPIIVNEEYEVIDGQGRLEALKTLHMPVDYFKIPGLTIEDCISMNINMKNWKTNDYIDSYANRNYPDYLLLKYLTDTFPGISLATIAGMAVNAGPGGGPLKIVREGKFHMTQEKAAEIYKTLQFISDVVSKAPELRGQNRAAAIGFCFNVKECDHTRLEKALLVHRQKISLPAKIKDVISEIQTAYNRGMKGGRIYFATEYEKSFLQSGQK